MDNLSQSALLGAAGLLDLAGEFIEDVFSTFLYTGAGATRTITNGIDLSGKGGLVWIKSRSQAGTLYTHGLWDTLRGPGFGMFQTQNKALDSSSTAQEGAGGLVAGETDYLSQFASNGFVLTPANNNMGRTSNGGITYASWTFRKQAKFFDVVTYTGNGVAGRTVPHNLGSVPGCIIVKRTDAASNWRVYHRSLGANSVLVLNEAGPAGSPADQWNNTTPSATTFTLGTATDVNGNGGTYVAYLFAHDAGGFGLTGTDNVISCGSFTTDGSGNATVSLGYEPQWVLYKQSTGTGNWFITDNMRGFPNPPNNNFLFANNSDAETSGGQISPTATGFFGSGGLNSSATFIYIAIRRGPMKVPTSGTSVFSPVAQTGTSVSKTITGTTPTDMVFIASRGGQSGLSPTWWDRLRGANNYLQSGSTSSEANSTTEMTGFDVQNGFTVGISNAGLTNASGWNYVYETFRRAPGFFDVVAYTGTGANRTVNHNLAAVPELMIVKSRGVNSWRVYSSGTGNQNILELQTTGASVASATTFNNTSPTASVFTVGTNNASNASGGTYIAYLFATVPGVSKVGSYTGNGSSQTINCGFTTGARFVLIKATSTTGDWVVFDTARGITAGNDPFLELNTTAAEQTGQDIIDPDPSGFIVNQTAESVNASGVSYIFLAIA